MFGDSHPKTSLIESVVDGRVIRYKRPMPGRKLSLLFGSMFSLHIFHWINNFAKIELRDVELGFKV